MGPGRGAIARSGAEELWKITDTWGEKPNPEEVESGSKLRVRKGYGQIACCAGFFSSHRFFGTINQSGHPFRSYRTETDVRFRSGSVHLRVPTPIWIRRESCLWSVPLYSGFGYQWSVVPSFFLAFTAARWADGDRFRSPARPPPWAEACEIYHTVVLGCRLCVSPPVSKTPYHNTSRISRGKKNRMAYNGGVNFSGKSQKKGKRWQPLISEKYINSWRSCIVRTMEDRAWIQLYRLRLSSSMAYHWHTVTSSNAGRDKHESCIPLVYRLSVKWGCTALFHCEL